MKSIVFSICFWSLVIFKVNDAVFSESLPIVINTWGPPFTNATLKAWEVINTKGSSSLDAVEAGCTECEVEQCDGTVGYGGSVTHDVGAVGCLKDIKNAIGVARSVMKYTKETFLVGEDATKFAKDMGFKEESLSTNNSIDLWKSWKKKNCQPNFRQNVVPDPIKSCGPYKPVKEKRVQNLDKTNHDIDENNHDTIGMVVIDADGNMAGGTSTNGASHKVPGRVGDSPIPGAGAYVDNDVGGAAATGDGDIMMRFLPSLVAVEYMRQGKSPTQAAELAMSRIAKYYPKFNGGLVAVNKAGEYGGAAHGWTFFKYSVVSPKLGGKVTVVPVKPL
ncbi:N(4)-(Beta-N-acetylglucosaminyl)-L-asparaginase-like isoform X2 [Actinia tenebrosa]|uniref:N(4)-(beta-N-acetylglucosaminyl)-L-asparaginase n=1 Tax=Actinia tenebrosa TaxID=6105 RepID=A0A6P8IEY5_ACTTE|nr:N(4)-(Beta-N-acetylglucosaminyl)-L-asparaginase-like isoform X2 [Actinia tenebrosa]